MKLIYIKYYFTLILILTSLSSYGQNRIGINTTTPDRPLEIRGTNTQMIRLQSTPVLGSESGLEMMTPVTDWKVSNDIGLLDFSYGNNSFGNLAMRFNSSGNLGIGLTNPLTRVQATGGATITNLTNDGHLMLGAKTSSNLVIDHYNIQARLNGAGATLYLQQHGGPTHFGPDDVNMVFGGGHLSLASAITSARFNIDNNNYHIYLSNDEGHINDWYIGASDDSWFVGDNQLIFSPTSSSNDAILRLMDVTDNNGDVAPVMIHSGDGQTLLLDGTEIDSKNGALYFNYNSEQNTIINASGGKVGIGTTNPYGILHINGSGLGLGLRQANTTWYWYTSVAEDLFIQKDNTILAFVSTAGGAWVAISDSRFKEQVRPIGGVMDKVMSLPLYSYQFIKGSDSDRDIGLLAQELEPLFPEAVSISNGQYGVMYGQLGAVAIKGVQEQQTQLEKLSAMLDILEE